MSVDFTAAGDGIDFGNLPAVDDLAQKTVMAWVNAQSYGHDVGEGVIITAGLNVEDGWTFDVIGIAGLNTITVDELFDGGLGVWRAQNGALATGSWKHVAFTYDNTSASNTPIFYINGVLSATNTVAAPSGTVITNSGSKLILGNRDLTGRSFNLTFDGDVEDTRIYDSILPADQIASIAAKKSFRLSAPFPVWRAKMIGATGLQIFGGTALAAGNTIIDDIGGTAGVPVSSPTANDSVNLAYQG